MTKRKENSADHQEGRRLYEANARSLRRQAELTILNLNGELGLMRHFGAKEPKGDKRGRLVEGWDAAKRDSEADAAKASGLPLQDTAPARE